MAKVQRYPSREPATVTVRLSDSGEVAYEGPPCGRVIGVLRVFITNLTPFSVTTSKPEDEVVITLSGDEARRLSNLMLVAEDVRDDDALYALLLGAGVEVFGTGFDAREAMRQQFRDQNGIAFIKIVD